MSWIQHRRVHIPPAIRCSRPRYHIIPYVYNHLFVFTDNPPRRWIVTASFYTNIVIVDSQSIDLTQKKKKNRFVRISFITVRCPVWNSTRKNEIKFQRNDRLKPNRGIWHGAAGTWRWKSDERRRKIKVQSSTCGTRTIESLSPGRNLEYELWKTKREQNENLVRWKTGETCTTRTWRRTKWQTPAAAWNDQRTILRGTTPLGNHTTKPSNW